MKLAATPDRAAVGTLLIVPGAVVGGRIVRDPMVFAVKADAPWKNTRAFVEKEVAGYTEMAGKIGIRR